MNESNSKLPSNSTLQHASRIAIVEDRPIMLDYWHDSLNGKIIIGVRENNEKLLVKSEDEYTSVIVKIFKIEEEFIILSENSLYIVNANCPTKRIS